MTKAELVAEIAERAGLSRTQARDALDALVACVTDAARSGREVRIVGFGAFVPVQKPAGLARNPKTGAQVERAASRTVRFRPGEALKNALN
jgi:DNA-binding protein HU-beta